MANIKGVQTIGNVLLLSVDSDPSASAGTTAPVGSLAIITGGCGIWVKNSALATDWCQCCGSIQAAISASDIDWNITYAYKTLAANTTFTFSNAVDARTIVVAITNTASNYTVTWPTVKWANGVAPTQTIGAFTDIYTFVRINGVVYGSYVQNLS